VFAVGTLSLDLRPRILGCYDEPEATREEVAERFRVWLGMVKKLLQPRRHTGDVAARHHYSGRKPLILEGHRQRLRILLDQKPDLSLRELRQALVLECSLPAIHYALAKMGLTYKKRPSGPANRTARTSPKRAAPGARNNPGWIRPN